MKILKEKYPIGTIKGQKSDGRYMDGYLYNNLEFMADRILKDMTFLGVIFSSTLEVGTGKSVLATQIGEAWTDIMNKKHKMSLTFSAKNLLFKPTELMQRAFELPKGSCIILDEWEDASYWSELGVALRRFFRKCRQLNLFMIVIIPNWFQFPMSYAVSRSLFAIDVKFGEGLERGFFDFYDFESKKYLYIKGKKFHNYRCQKSTFYGRFTDGYGLPEKEYRDAKLKDMLEDTDGQKKPVTDVQKNAELLKKLEETFQKFFPNFNVPTDFYSHFFGKHKTTINQWRRGEYTVPLSESEMLEKYYNNKHIEKEIIWNEDEIEGYEKTKEDS